MAYAVTIASGSTSGRVIPILATATPGTLLHTAVAGATSFDEVYISIANVTAAAATITIEWGGVTDPGDHIVKGLSIPANSTQIMIVPGFRINGGLAIRGFSPTSGALNAAVNNNRITP